MLTDSSRTEIHLRAKPTHRGGYVRVLITVSWFLLGVSKKKG